MRRIAAIPLLLLACLPLTAAVLPGLPVYREPARQQEGLAISGISISPQEVRAGQRIAIDVTVSNTGPEAVTCNLEILIDYQSVNTQEITVPPRGNTQTHFAFFPKLAGHYDVTAIIPGDRQVSSFEATPHPILANFTVRFILALIFCILLGGLIVLIGEKRHRLGLFREELPAKDKESDQP